MRQQETQKTQKSAWMLDLMVSAWFISIGVFFSVALIAIGVWRLSLYSKKRNVKNTPPEGDDR